MSSSDRTVPAVTPLLYRPAEAAEALGISPSQLYVLRNAGEIPWVVLGSTLRIPVADLEELVRERTVWLKPPPGSSSGPASAR